MITIRTPFHFLYYFLYKFIKLTTPNNKQSLVADSALNLLLICITNNGAAIIMETRLVKFFPENIYLSVGLFAIFPIGLYFLSRKLFIQQGRYDDIARYYDQKNDLKKYHFIIFSVFYIVFSLTTMIWSGINYEN